LEVFVKKFRYYLQISSLILAAVQFAAGGLKADVIENKQTALTTGEFSSTWTVTPSHSPMDGVTGLAKGVVGTFGDMGILVRMNSSGKVDARNGTIYQADADLDYFADSTYTITVTGNVATQTYSVTVTPPGGAPVAIATDYAFRSNTSQDSLNYLAMLVNELVQFGGVPGSDLNPSFIDFDYSELFEDDVDISNWSHYDEGNVFTVEEQDPTGGVNGSGALRLSDGGFTFLAKRPIKAAVGTNYTLTMDVKTRRWDDQATFPIYATVQGIDNTPDTVFINNSTDFTSITLNGVAATAEGFIKIEGFNNSGQDTVWVDNVSFDDNINNVWHNDYSLINTNNESFVEIQTGSFSATYTMQPTANNMDGVFSFAEGAPGLGSYGSLSTIVRCNQSGKIDARNGTFYDADNDLSYSAGTKYAVKVDFDVVGQTYDVTVTPEGGGAVVIADNYAFRAAGDTLTHASKIVSIGGHWGGVAGDLIITDFTVIPPTDPIQNKQTALMTDVFSSTWTVTPTHSPMDGVTGLAKGVVGTFGDMGILVRMNSSGKVDARNGGGYQADADLDYFADSTYTITVTGNVETQAYSVTVTPEGGAPVAIATDYAFRPNTPQDSLNYFAVVINELTQFGGVPGSRLRPSFINDDYALINTNNVALAEAQTGNFTATYTMQPTANNMDGVFAFAEGAPGLGSYGSLSTIVRCNQSGKIDARNGTFYDADNDLSYSAGTKYAVKVDFDVVGQTYNVTVTPEGGSAVVIADNYAFRAAGDTLTHASKIVSIGGHWGGVPGDLIITDFIIGTVGINGQDGEIPLHFALEQNYPNPFNPSTTIKYAIAKSADVSVSIFNVRGQKVVTLVNQKQPAGSYSIVWNGRDTNGNVVASGIYLYQIQAGEFVESRKMQLVK